MKTMSIIINESMHVLTSIECAKRLHCYEKNLHFV